MKTFHIHGGIMVIIIIFIPFHSVATDIITPTQPLAINQTISSSGEAFELGFFNFTNNKFYLGIWYREIKPRTIVWVANRDVPVISAFAKLTIADDGNINLVDQSETAIWSSNHSVAPPATNMVAQLLDSGNFVLRRENDDDPENYIWQSFDHLTDTLLPGMKLGWSRKTGINRFLRSWKSDNDPGSGDYSYGINLNGFPELVLWNKETVTYRTGAWNGVTFSGIPEMKRVRLIDFEFIKTSDEVYYSYKMVNNSVHSRFLVSSVGRSQRYVWTATNETWSLYWEFPVERCDNYGRCGPFGVCDTNSLQICNCLKGFRPRDEYAWFNLQNRSNGCVRSSIEDCGSDGFLPLKNVKLPEGSKAFVDPSMNLSQCGEICKRNCSCTAYANMDVTRVGSGCVYWVVDLMDMKKFAEYEGAGQDLYVRVGVSDLEELPTTRSSKTGSDNNHIVMIAAITSGICIGLITLLILLYIKRKKRRRLLRSITRRTGSKERSDSEIVMDELDLPLFDFRTLAMATNNFSNANELGKGGFGCVYKGTLPGGEVVAVKRLSRVSDQGIEELTNEVRLIAKLQHINLVRLLGCCIEVEEKLLIYEFMENRSLDTFLFDKEKSMKLNWQLRLDIILGITRGLLYLHQDSRLKIIHRDLKASNILLDAKMNPKISDFGLARIFGSDQIEARTKKVVGTYGYMSPEYAMNGHFSTKSDVFSFGVLVLEIISGQKNRGSSYTSSELNLLGHTWTLWKEGKILKLVDESVRSKFVEDEALKCIQIGLLCVQEHKEDRPYMSEVLWMLNSETAQLPLPKYPGFFIGKRKIDVEPSTKQDDFISVNEVTITMLDGSKYVPLNPPKDYGE
ncbi:hypothetical protein OSB04_002269 [Centaurea solstitialis]|uniref:Receptor-like serine/threonine-protein kinase n=1 Tax=Centaurea solstitialis TaxID=347529 RepID=A0AA38UB45_9ASTR|nr:hypothetical protein OSB04_002269 [Centaurea solstitialis]